MALGVTLSDKTENYPKDQSSRPVRRQAAAAAAR